jgi:hypothetical protein
MTRSICRFYPFWVLGVLLVGCEGRAAPSLEQVPADSESTNAAISADAPEPPSGRARAPAQIRGLYLNAYAAGSRTRLPRLMAIADSTEINAFVIDVKTERGVHYTTSIPLAKELQASAENTLRDLSALVDTLHARDIYAIARIVVFKDPILSKARPDWSVQKPGGGLWMDKAGNTWVSPWHENVWDYNISIAEEAARAGFDEIQFDYVRFAEPYASLPPQVHPQARGDRTDAIAAFLNTAKSRLHPLGAVVAADVFGLSPNDPGDVNIGQQWETIASTADHILPMMYPSHYLPTHLPGVPRPDLMPYDVLFKSAGMAVVRNEGLREAGVTPARIIPWLQAFTASWLSNHLDYGPEELRQQKQGVYDVGLDDWILWHPGSRYEPFLPGLERNTEPRAATGYAPPPEIASLLARFERQGVEAARQKAADQARGDTSDPEAARAARTGQEEPGSD